MQNKTKQINLQQIPEELKKFKNWVLWSYQKRNGRPAKIPKQINGKEASITNQATWTTFDNIIHTHNQPSNQFDGIGFVFTDTPYMGIDIDDCRDPQTGIIKEWAVNIIQVADSYTEISPSATGIKIFLKGKLPGDRKKQPKFYSGAIEMYDSRRYFTVTGQRIQKFKEIKENQNGIDRIYKHIFTKKEKTNNQAPAPKTYNTVGGGELLEKIVASKNGAKFLRLWKGDISNYQSQSDADLALCKILAFWSGGDPAKIDSLFRSSELMREKWKREDYRSATIKKALEGQTQFYKPKQPKPKPKTNQQKPKKEDDEYILYDKGATTAERLIHIGKKAELFCTPGGENYARFPVDGHKEVGVIGHRNRFGFWLVDKFLECYEKPPNTSAVITAIDSLKAMAIFRGGVKEVHTRIATHQGALYIDLCNEDRQTIRVTGEKWEIIDHPPVFFKRNKGMEALPIPQDSGDINDLWQFINVKREENGGLNRDMLLMLGWVFGCFMPHGSYVHMMLLGEQGTAKSTATKILRSFIDPNTAPNNNIPRERRDLVASACNSWVVAFDNVSFLDKWLSDDLCRLSTGAGNRDRELYTNTDEVVTYVKRPVICNGINEVITRGDLLDRLICITLKPIAKYKDEGEIDQKFSEVYPKIFKCILDNLVIGMKNYNSIKVESSPRMADFVKWNEAIFSGWAEYEPGIFTNAFKDIQREAVELQVQESPLANAIIAYVNRMGGTKILPSALHANLNQFYNKQECERYPKSSRALGLEIRRQAPGLRKVGYQVEFVRSHGKRWISLKKK